jgi:predicted Zn-dependent peptidase
VNVGTSVGAALLGAALVVSSHAGVRADTPALDGTLPSGGTYLVRPVAGAPVAAIALWYRASSSGFDALPAPGLGRLAATAVAASQPITGTPLGTFINRLGGRMSISAYPESVSVSLLVPADRAPQAIKALTRSFFAPVLTDAGLQAARRTVAEEAAIRSMGPESTIEDSLYATLFAAGPDKAPPFPAPAALDGFTLAQVRSYAERAFRPANAVLVLSGAVTPELTGDALTGREGADPLAETVLPKPVAQPTAVSIAGTDPGFGLAWAGPPIADEAAATAFDFIADYLFGDGGALQRAAAAAGTTLDGTFVTYHDPGVFIVEATGGNVAATRSALTAAIAAIEKPLPAVVFERARRQFTYRLLSHAQTPDLIADNYGWYTVEGGSAYTPGEGGASGAYLRAVAALTPASVAAAATRYLSRPAATVTMATDDAAPAPVATPAATPAAAASPKGKTK